MLSSIPAVRDELKARLEAALPDDWAIVKDLTAANVSLVPAVYIEFTELSTLAEGAQLPPGQVCATVDLVLVDPRTADGEAEAAIEDEIVPLLKELDTSSDLGWSTARKIRQDSGPLSWRVSLIALTTL
ncbi:hypothetical protein FGL91_14830 [Microbacterium sp. CBA3102]|uniref:hypothetical protein n=1 Tax=Microbacterium sp. CBA3102 TaxID=2603598 RepID=UPI0011BAFB12|nr:hypothetical protein [Microbacterium sp. CBA3102]QEA29711.1 hypothetical protein FGL91_14830 [Microbacterium sp. CBA3102]